MLLVAAFADQKLYYLTNDYYVILRLVLSFSSAYLAYLAISARQLPWIFIFLLILVFFNPIFPVPISKRTWMILDLIFAVILAASVLFVGERVTSKHAGVVDD